MNPGQYLIPDTLLSTLSFISENLGEYTSYSPGMLAWHTKSGDVFLFLTWDDDGILVQITDGVEPDGRGNSHSVYTIFGYCRYQGIAHELIGGSLPKVS